jgi:CheY-like chemotaxis protein
MQLPGLVEPLAVGLDDPWSEHEQADPEDELGLHRFLTVVLAEDDGDLRSMLADVLREDGCRVVEVADGATLLAGMIRGRFDDLAIGENALLLTDFRMPKLDGLGVVRALRARGRHPRFVLMTAFAESELHAEAQLLGAIAVLHKPFDLQDLRLLVRQVARRFALQ